MSRIITHPPCDCCGAEYRATGCVRGYGCGCRGFTDYCEVCKYCTAHCHCDDEMKEKFVVAHINYLEALRVIRKAHPKRVNPRRVYD